MTDMERPLAMEAVETATLRITRVGQPRGDFPERARVDFVTEGRCVDRAEVEACLDGVDDDTLSVGQYHVETRTGYYTVVDAYPLVAVGQCVDIPAVPQLDEVELRRAYDAGVQARGNTPAGWAGDEYPYWTAWGEYQDANPVIAARVSTQSLYFHGGYYGCAYSSELSKHPMDRLPGQVMGLDDAPQWS